MINNSPYMRLSLDVGTTSIGWALLGTDEAGECQSIIKTGVRIFDNGRDDKSEAPLNQKRQSVRSARRRQDRTVQRRKAVIQTLVKFGFMPTDEQSRKALENLDPYQIRNDGLTTEQKPYHMGRAFFHLTQRRGYKSNRKSDAGNEEGGAIKTGIEKLESQMMLNGSRTVGQYLYQQKKQGKTVLSRPIAVGSKNEYEFYLQRNMLEEEFDKLWNNQKQYSPTLYNDKAREGVFSAIFYQRPLKSKKEHVGLCSILYNEKTENGEKYYRIAKALPTFQNFRILQQLINLRYIDDNGFGHSLYGASPDLFKQFYKTLCVGKNLSFKEMRTALKKAGIIDSDYTFNFESETESKFDGAETAHALFKKKRRTPIANLG